MRTVARYRIALVREDETKAPPRANLSSPRGVFRFLGGLLGETDREHFLVFCLSVRNDLLGYNEVSVGSLNASIIHPREVFKAAILMNAAAIVVAHNHPSGDPSPTREDQEITRVLTDAGRILDVPLHDHVIVGGQSYFSFRDAGLL